jgi:hypothetical protein
MSEHLTPKQALCLAIMQLEVSAWQDGRDCEEDVPEMSARTERYRDQIMAFIDDMVAGIDPMPGYRARKIASGEWKAKLSPHKPANSP